MKYFTTTLAIILGFAFIAPPSALATTAEHHGRSGYAHLPPSSRPPSLTPPTIQAETFFCPNTLQYISTGTTGYQVEQKCGLPAVKQTVEEPEFIEVEIQQLFYQPEPSLRDRPSNRFSDNVEINLSFTVENNRVRSIRIAGEEVSSTNLCSSSIAIQVGDPAYAISTACGKPGFVNYTTRQEEIGMQEITLWTYNFGAYHPEVIFKFVDDVLVEIIQDQNQPWY